jgi:hypothetical protein
VSSAPRWNSSKSYQSKQKGDWWQQSPERFEDEHSELEAAFIESPTPGGYKSKSALGQSKCPVPSHSSTNWSTLLTRSLCRSSRDPLLSPNPSPSSKGVKSKYLISCGVNLR